MSAEPQHGAPIIGGCYADTGVTKLLRFMPLRYDYRCQIINSYADTGVRINTVRRLIIHSTESLEKMLFNAFPQRVVQGTLAPHECEECWALREQLSGVTWQDVPGEFIRANDGALPLLSHAAYLAFLPAWLRQGVLDPNGPVAGMLLVNLHLKPNIDGFSRRQAKVVMEVARFLTQSNVYGPADPGNVESLSEIERVWSSIAA